MSGDDGSRSISFSVRITCAELDTGSSSAAPWITARTTIFQKSTSMRPPGNETRKQNDAPASEPARRTQPRERQARLLLLALGLLLLVFLLLLLGDRLLVLLQRRGALVVVAEAEVVVRQELPVEVEVGERPQVGEVVAHDILAAQ